jgi:hypothetical protein
MANLTTKKSSDEKKAIESLHMSDEDIIKQIFTESGKDYFNSTENVSKSVAYFAVLISRLSVKSDKLQKRMLWLNGLVATLTIVLLLTIPQVNKFVVNIFSANDHKGNKEQSEPHKDSNNQKSQNIHNPHPNKQRLPDANAPQL